MDWYTCTPQFKTLYGIYGDDFITYGEYSKDLGDVLSDEEALIKIADETDTTSVLDKTTFSFRDNRLSYKREVNGDLKDLEVDHPIAESQL